jgi:hypothetical protein
MVFICIDLCPQCERPDTELAAEEGRLGVLPDVDTGVEGTLRSLKTPVSHVVPLRIHFVDLALYPAKDAGGSKEGAAPAQNVKGLVIVFRGEIRR